MKIQSFLHKRFIIPVSRILAINYIEGKMKLVSRGSNPQICNMGVKRNVHQGNKIYSLHLSGQQTMERDKNLRIYTKMHLIFSLCSGFNHLPLAKVGSCTSISCYFCPLNPIYTQECIFQNWTFWKFLISTTYQCHFSPAVS